MSVTIKDIAKAAGVSYPTVSKALRGTGSINEETARRIKRIAREQGYVPSIAARTMATQKSQLIAVFLPQIAASFYNKILQGIENLAIQNSYSVLLYLFENTNIEDKLETLLSHQVDGIIIFNNHFSLTILERFKKQNIPLLFVNSTKILPDSSHIEIDTHYGLKLAFGHLAALNHRKVLLVLSKHEDEMKRIAEIRKTVPSTYNIKLKSKAYCDNYSSAEVYNNFQIKDIQNGITAIVCTSDSIAIPIISRLQQHHIAIPGDISIIGFDDIEFSAVLNPPLTTVEQPKKEFGERVFHTLLGLMQGEPEQRLVMLPKLIVRGTTRKLEIGDDA